MAARVVALAAGALGATQEQWNGPADTQKCDAVKWDAKWTSWTDDFAPGERAITMYSESYTCGGVDCDVVGAFAPKYSFSCATKGQGATEALDPVVKYTMIGGTSEFHSEKPCRFLDEKVGPAPEPLVALDEDGNEVAFSYW